MSGVGATGKTPSITIIGGGFGGIAAAVKLKRAGITTFTIFEQSEGIGGTWWDNIYPGAEVDVGSHLYSYSFHRHDWSRTHARQTELQQYLEGVVDDFGLRPHFRLQTTVKSAVWNEETHAYTVTLADGESFASQVVVSAVGLLNVPRYPDWPGLDDFAGPCSSANRDGSFPRATETSPTRSASAFPGDWPIGANVFGSCGRSSAVRFAAVSTARVPR